jgi:glutamine synthetase
MSVVEEIVTALLEAGVQVLQFHSEGAPGQIEFVLGPLPPLEAVDSLYLAKQIIGATAVKHAMHTTFHPQPFQGQLGSG